MIVLDEPTNDLDVDTLELLEDLLADYEGTLLLVSHDRTFLDNVVTSTLVFEGNAKFGEYAGGYEDYERYRQLRTDEELPEPRETVAITASTASAGDRRNSGLRKLSYKEQRELEALPEKIEALEMEQARLHQRMGEADFYRQPSDKITAAIERLDSVKNELESCYARWESLEELAGGTA
jgi:ATP-binding cassette subfamily F protein uup